jgi:hypothetical protein
VVKRFKTLATQFVNPPSHLFSLSVCKAKRPVTRSRDGCRDSRATRAVYSNKLHSSIGELSNESRMRGVLKTHPQGVKHFGGVSCEQGLRIQNQAWEMAAP